MTTTHRSTPVVIALARLEARKATTSPLFLFGVAMLLVGAGVFVAGIVRERAGELATWGEDGWTLHIGMFLFGLFVLMSANRAVLRDRREGTGDHHEALPVPRSARVAGLLASQVWPAAIGSVLFLATAVFAATRLDVPALEVVHGVERFTMIVMLGTLGVALAAWLPHAMVAPMAAFGFFVASPPEIEAAWHSAYPYTVLDTFPLAGWQAGSSPNTDSPARRCGPWDSCGRRGTRPIASC